MLKEGLAKIKTLFSRRSYFKKQFQGHFGFKPNDSTLFRIAFSHRSSSFINKHHFAGYHNERLEFLGDAVLSNILAESLFYQFPEANEGMLTRMRSDLAKRENLNDWGELIGIPKFLQFDQSLSQNPQSSRTMYGNAFEAFVGATFLDKGYYFTYRFINDHLLKTQVNFESLKQTDTNYKSQLTEWAQQNGVALHFHLDDQIIDQGQTVFVISTWINNAHYSKGKGYRKKAAEQEAARKALQYLQLESVT